jgi:Tetratricopeptide repeat
VAAAARDRGLVVVTSRDGAAASWGRWCSRHRVGPLPAPDAAVMLADYAGGVERIGSAEDLVVLAGRLGGLPLAVKIAGSYLAAAARVPAVFAEEGTVRTCREYLAALEGWDLAAVFPAGTAGPVTAEAARGLVGRAWELTLDLLEGRGMPEARAVLRLLACFADAPVPCELLLHPGAFTGVGPLAGVSGARVWQALTALADHGLADLGTSGAPGGIAVARLHPLVRDASRPAAGSMDQLAFLGLAARLLRRAAESEETGLPEDPAGWPAWQLLAPHATAVLAAVTADPGCPDETAEAAAYAAQFMARYQAGQGMHAHAGRQYQDVLTARLRVLGPDHPDTLAARHCIALEMAEQGSHAAAEAEFRDVLAARLRVLGPDHPSTRVTAEYVGGVGLGRLAIQPTVACPSCLHAGLMRPACSAARVGLRSSTAGGRLARSTLGCRTRQFR